MSETVQKHLEKANSAWQELAVTVGGPRRSTMICRMLRYRVCHSCHSYRYVSEGGDEAVAAESEFLFTFAPFDFARHASDIVEAVEGVAYTTQSDETTCFEHVPITHYIQRTGGGDRFGRARGFRQANHRGANR